MIATVVRRKLLYHEFRLNRFVKLFILQRLVRLSIGYTNNVIFNFHRCFLEFRNLIAKPNVTLNKIIFFSNNFCKNLIALLLVFKLS